MIIDFSRYSSNLLPLSIRKSRLTAFISALLEPIRYNYQIITDRIEKARLYSACTWQVCWLEYLLRRELNDNSITITEGGGLPTDFLVVTENTNATLIKGLLNRFKLNGKSYLIRNTNELCEARWSDPVCVLATVVDAVRWIDPVCELGEVIDAVRWIDPICVKIPGVIQVVDQDRNVVSSINYDKDGNLMAPPNTLYYIEYPQDISVFNISGDVDPPTVGLDEVETGKSLLLITVVPHPTNIGDSNWVVIFDSNGQGYHLNIIQRGNY